MTTLSELEQAAQSAPPGPWIRWCYEGQSRSGKHQHSVCAGNLLNDDKGHTCVATTLGHTEEESGRVGTFIATWNPSTALKLVAVVKAARDMREVMTLTGSYSDGTWEQSQDRFDAALAELEGK